MNEQPKLHPGEVIEELRRRLADDSTTLALFERHIVHDREAVTFALTADRTIVPPAPPPEEPHG